MLSMKSNGHHIGHQRFHLLNPNTALGVTAFSTPTANNIEEFRKLLAASPLRELHWLNIALHRVALRTVVNEDRKI